MLARKLDRRLLAFVVALVTLQATHNALPYLGLRDDSCQTMFSGLTYEARANNHHFVPQRAVSDLWRYVTDVEARIEPAQPASARVGYLRDWLNAEDRRLNTEALRAVVWQICDAGHRVRLRYRDPVTGRMAQAENACDVERLSSPRWAVPVRLYETDLPALP
ncbi:MAG TPA: hypothetical protein RMH99_14600 [Sandaracinaceae bacterium LLY-WYZ-13_1]|nr:hypothetical protein [Sandaracinaceae bacterium LLY-WYZ-13_1]